jgi:sulfur carrier protein ThiS
MKIRFPDGHEEDIPGGGRRIELILQDLNLNLLEFLIARGEEIIPEDTIPCEEDTIHLIRISHGG